MIGFAQIKGGAPSSTKALREHLMNSTLTPTQDRLPALSAHEGHLASYYQRGMVHDAQELQYAKRDMENAEHFAEWMGGKVSPDLVRLAEYATLGNAELTSGDIEYRLSSDLERAIERATIGGGEPLSAEVRELHGLPEPPPLPAYLADLSVDELQTRLGKLQERWWEATAAADYRADVREVGSVDPDAPVGVVRPDLHPAVAIALDIGPTRRLSDQEIDALLAGRRADGEKIEGKHYAPERSLPPDPKTGEERRSYPIGSYDFSPAPDKSVSVAWAFANPQEQARIYDAHIQASRQAMAYIAERIGQVRLGNGGADGSEPGHVGWIEFTHHTSRRTQIGIENGEVVFLDKGKQTSGDPDLHTHFLIPNAVIADSGKIGSLDTAQIGGFIFEADALYHARIAQHLTDAQFDVTLDQRTGAARMTAIPEDLCSVFSKRTNMGELLARKMTAERGEDWDALSQDQREARMKNATQDREQKIRGDKDDVADFQDWQRQAKEMGWEPPASFLSRVHTVELAPAMKQQMAYDVALPILDEKLQHRAVVTHFEPRIAAARGMIAMGGGDLSDIEAITTRMQTDGVQQYGQPTALVWGVEDGRRYTSVTTALHESEEREFIALAQKASADRSGATPMALLQEKIAASGLDLADAHGLAQRSMIERLGTGGKFGIGVGAAGAGKSTLLQPLVAAWNEQGRDVYGANLATRHADQLTDAGIDQRRTMPFVALIDRLASGDLKLSPESVVVIDEIAMLGTRQGLQLLRAQDRHGFSVVALGDDKQIGSIQAGAIVDLSRRALGPGQVPEIVTTVRQQTERERVIVGLFRDGRAAEALDMKRTDGTAEMVAGGYDGVVARVAALYQERLHTTGIAPTIAAPTNQDAHRVSEAVRQARRALGMVGADLMAVRATDGERNYLLPLAAGDRVRLFGSTNAQFTDGKRGAIGRNGSVLEVVDADKSGITLRGKSGKVGKVAWETLETKGRTRLAYGDAMTIHTAQGTTSREHILALPSGSSAIDGNTGYSGNTRHRQSGYILTNEARERDDVRKRRPLNDTREITLNDRWANVARALSYQPEKDTAVALFERTAAIVRGGVKGMHMMPDISRAASAAILPAHQVAQRRSLDIAIDRTREMLHYVYERVRQVPTIALDRMTHRHERTLGQGRGLEL